MIPEQPETGDPIFFATFLESYPPGQMVQIDKICEIHKNQRGHHVRVLFTPDLQLHCPKETCNGTRFFRFHQQPIPVRSPKVYMEYLNYRCSNCQNTEKIFSVLIEVEGDELEILETGSAFKFGKIPPFGPQTPPRLISLIGPDREIFLKGRQCENQGLGIGAFIYYRRVVENQKTRILEEILKVAQKINANDDTLKTLENAAGEIQFANAMKMTKPALPESLLINGHNPLSLLHSALSKGVHEMDDEECLSTAGSIRVVLRELSDRLGQALRDEAELQNAIGTLLNRDTQGSENVK